jgi:hypothetical protein
MRYTNSEPAGGDVYLSSPPPASVPPGYHKIQGWVKRNAPTPTFWGWGSTEGIVEETIGKVAYQSCRSLLCNGNLHYAAARRSWRPLMNMHQCLRRPARKRTGTACLSLIPISGWNAPCDSDQSLFSDSSAPRVGDT